ncbi:tetratricopeptide repeat protein [Nannocystis pusilla]|uniref:tetratricopeptide repeat protein n=1 Tax=Nannocystis pusilla TaxID=889268 RepID=UPI003B7D4173
MSSATGSKEQATAQPSAADLSAQAIERFNARDYDAAVRLFEEAYAIDKVPNYLFNIGRVYEEKGDIRSAVDYYQRFVKEPGVEIEARDLALQRLRVLKGILQETDPGEKPAEAAPAPAPVAEGRSPSRRR